jgi:hypothetical protein
MKKKWRMYFNDPESAKMCCGKRMRAIGSI